MLYWYYCSVLIAMVASISEGLFYADEHSEREDLKLIDLVTFYGHIGALIVLCKLVFF